MTIIRKICFLATATAFTASAGAVVAFATKAEDSKKEEAKLTGELVWSYLKDKDTSKAENPPINPFDWF